MPKPESRRTISEFVGAQLIAPDKRAELEAVAEKYSVSITTQMAAAINRDDERDPIALQFVPQLRELAETPRELVDPIGDHAHSPVRGIVHRYPDRVLLTPTYVCPVYCRFCFRRETVGPNGPRALSSQELGEALAYIRSQKEIWEVIVTGGDPLILSPRRLKEISDLIDDIDHVKILRFHTRVPVVCPSVVVDELVRAIRPKSKATYVVLHTNHANELTPEAAVACGRIVDAGIPMLSQSVLLKGINDSADAMGALMRRLVELRVKPYYLHHGDLAPGTSHFRTTIASGQMLMKQLRGRLSGMCQPTYVLDIPGGFGKSPIGPSYIERRDLALCDRSQVEPSDEWPSAYKVTDYQNVSHTYADDVVPMKQL